MTRLKSPHGDFRLDLISPVDVRAVGLDQLLTHLWLKVLLENRTPRRRTRDYTTVAELAQEIEREGNDRFVGFERTEQVTEAWLRADLVRPMRKDPTLYTVARPVHDHAVRLRSSNRQASDSNASEAVYAWIWHHDRALLDELRSLVAMEIDPTSADLVTLALFHLGGAHEADEAARPDDAAPDPPVPLSSTRAKTYCEDARRLLAYSSVLPRPVLIAHLRRLTAFHLGLYLLKVFEIVGTAEAAGRVPETEPALELVVDLGEDAGGPVARFAEESWDRREQALHRYVHAHLALKKLHQYAQRAQAWRKSPVPESLAELVELERTAPAERLDADFDAQLQALIADNDKDSAAELETLAADYRGLGMTPFRVYHAVIVRLKARNWFGYHRQVLDYLFAKNTTDGLLRQPLGGGSKRRAAMGAGLLETLTFVALVRGEPGGFYTHPLRVDELIAALEERYDLCIVSPPREEANDLEVARVLAANGERCKARLRETGLYRDLSDAFVAQLVRPRVPLG